MREGYRRENYRNYRRGGNPPQKRRKLLQRKILLFSVFTFLLGMLFGKLVFAEGADEAAVYEEEAREGREYVRDSRTEADADLMDGDESWKLTLVNAWTPLEEEYEPVLAEAENNYDVDARIADSLQEMLADGRKEGLDFWICSAYRTIEKQAQLYEDKVRRLQAEGMSYERARKEAGTEVAYPGTSEHHLGLAVDIVARDYQLLDEKQANTEEAKWLAENCWKYGFILRYPPDKTEETGIIFEPWHYRYVGEEAAREIMDQGICLEEYLEQRASGGEV